MRRSALPFALTLALTLPLAACGDGSTEDPSTTREGDGQAESTDRTERTPRATGPRVETPALPDAPALTDDAATSVLHSVLGDLEADSVTREMLLYLTELQDTDALETARATLLAKVDGEYDDPANAALGLETQLAAGDQSAAGDAITLAKTMLDDEDENPAIAWALSRIEGPRQGEAEALLARLAISFDDEVSMLALETLAKRRSPAAAAHLADIAGDAENADMVRATAVAAMLMTSAPGASAAADALSGGDAVEWEVIDGFAVAGAADAVPYIQRMVDRALADGNADFEFTSACYALAEIYGDGPGADKGRALIEAWLAADEDLDTDAATYALWAMGDNGRASDAALLLTREVATAGNTDAEMAVALLDLVARRGLARDPRFRKAVDAAAVAADRKGLPGLDLTTPSLRAAAAHAYLRSR